VDKTKFLRVAVVIILFLVTVHGGDTSVREALSWGLKIQGIDEPSKIVQGYLVPGTIHPGTCFATETRSKVADF
jgi:hypothetical protein